MSENNWTFSDDSAYSFGFTGWQRANTEGEWVDDMDPFEIYVREARQAAGLEVGPPRKKWVPNSVISGQILYSGTMSVPSPRYHAQVIGITGGNEEDTGTDDAGHSDSTVHSSD